MSRVDIGGIWVIIKMWYADNCPHNKQSNLYYKEFTVSPSKIGVKTPLTQEDVQSKPLIAEVSLAEQPIKPPRPHEAIKVRLNVALGTTARSVIKAAVCIWFDDVQCVTTGRHTVALKQYPDGWYATHLAANGIHLPLLHP